MNILSKVGNDVLLLDDERIVGFSVCPKHSTIISGESLIDTMPVNQATELFFFFLVPLVVKHLSFWIPPMVQRLNYWIVKIATTVQYITKSNLILSANIILYAV